MSDFMAVVPLFCKDLRASLYKPFFIKFYPLFYSPGALFGNFGLVAISLILFIHAVSFAYSFSLLNILISLNKPFWFIMISCFFLSFQVFCLYRIIVPTSPEETIFMAQVGRNLQEKQAIFTNKTIPNSPLYKFPPLSNN